MDPIENHKFLSSDSDQIDESGHEEFFREDFIIFQLIGEETDELELWDCNLTRVLVCEHLSVADESEKDCFTALHNGVFRIIVNSKSIPKNIQPGSRLLMKSPFNVFSHQDKIGIIAPTLTHIP